MKRVSVDSTMISEVGYEAGSRILEVKFSNGSVGRYLDVPQEVYNGILSAKSPGRYLIDKVKPNYHYERT